MIFVDKPISDINKFTLHGFIMAKPICSISGYTDDAGKAANFDKIQSGLFKYLEELLRLLVPVLIL